VPTVVKSGSLKLLEPPGSVQACTGVAFLLLAVNRYVFYLRVSECPSFLLHEIDITCTEFINGLYC
jgi:hypothetical protein